jgi:hypothetical protein
MRETAEDVAALQALLDRSYAVAGAHLLSIHDPNRRGTAEQLVERLTGMCLLVLATVTADGRPLTGPVDSVFFRGAFHFSSSPDSVRLRHLAKRPHVSATHLPGEQFAVTVHGSVRPVSSRGGELREAILEAYGPQFEDFLNGVPTYYRIDAERMFGLVM